MAINMSDHAADTLASPCLAVPLSTKHIRPQNAFETFPLEAIEQSLAARFEQQARRYADRIAIKTRQRTLTYTELNQLANQVASTIGARCEQQKGPVALLFGQGVQAIVAMFGAWKAGRCCVILDAAQPLARLASMLEDSQAGCIVTATPYLPLVQQLPLRTQLVIDMDCIASQCPAEDLHLKT